MFAGLSLAAALLAAFAALQAPPLQAQSTTVTLVSNAAVGARSLISSDIHAQSFTTGPDEFGYFISTVRLNLDDAAGRNIAVRLKENNSSNRPGNLLETLTNPVPLMSFGVNTFTVPNDRILDPNTTYWITINEGVSGTKARVRARSQKTEVSAYGWTIGNLRLFKSSQASNWTSISSTVVHLVISGTVRTASTDATLSGLSLFNDSGDGVALSPGFSSGHLDYSASVEFPVSQATVIPTKNHAGASIRYLNDIDEELGDGDTFQLFLAEGSEHLIKVEVTAEDDIAKETYTLTVTRAARPGEVLLSEKRLSLTEGNGAYYSVVLNRQPAADVTVTIGGHAGTNVTPNPANLTFTTSNWSRSRSVFVSTTADTNTTNESVRLTHTATSSDSLFDDITIPSVIVNVDDQDAPDHHIRTITVPHGLPLGNTALPEEEFAVWTGPPFAETIEGVTQGHRWSPSGLWGDPDADIIWVVDPIHFGIHALKLSALEQGRVERHIAADTSEFDQRFNYRCHFSESRASGYGNPSLTVMWGSPTRVLIANESSGTLDAYDWDSSITNQCYTENVTSWAANGQSYTTARENFKSPFGFVREFDLPLGPLTVRGIWANSTRVWLSGPPGGVYTLALGPAPGG